MNPDLKEKNCDGDTPINNQDAKNFILLHLQLIPAGLLFRGVNWHNWIAILRETVSKQLEADLDFNCASGHGFPQGTSRLNLQASSVFSEIRDIIKSVNSFQACLSILLGCGPPQSPLSIRNLRRLVPRKKRVGAGFVILP